jgi:APA family basic amino acid/polyamine antiporter
VKVEPRLTAFDGAMVVVSLVIGIGLFRTPALVASHAGSTPRILLAWTIGGVISMAGALVFAELGSRAPRAGGFYAIIAETWHPLAGFVVNWAQVLMQGVGAATVALIGAEYLLRLAGRSSGAGMAMPIAAALLAGLTALNAAGIRAGARTQNALSLAKIVLIAGLMIAGLSIARTGGDAAAGAAGAPGGTMLAALVAVFYTYGGYQNTMNLAGDVRDPRRNLPLAICGGMALVTLLYLALNATYVRGLGAAGVAASPLVAADLARAALGPRGEAFVSLAIFLSAAGFLNATILHMPRGYLAMAKDGLLPQALGRLDPATQAQRGGLLFFAATALVPLFFLASFERLVSYVMFTDTLSLALLASCLFVMRRRGAASPDPIWTMPGYPWVALVFVLVTLGVAFDLLVRETAVALSGLVVAAAGVPLYMMMRRARSARLTPSAAGADGREGRR